MQQLFMVSFSKDCPGILDSQRFLGGLLTVLEDHRPKLRLWVVFRREPETPSGLRAGLSGRFDVPAAPDLA